MSGKTLRRGRHEKVRSCIEPQAPVLTFLWHQHIREPMATATGASADGCSIEIARAVYQQTPSGMGAGGDV
jgi:hypothetical protein